MILEPISRVRITNITVLFFGSHDDCEALAFGLRMAEHPGISLSVVHISAGPGMVAASETQATQDGRSIDEVKENINNNDSIKYEERTVESGSETVEAIRDFSGCNLFLVGKSQQGAAANLLSLKSDCPELGPVGGLLASAEFSTSASVLVIQQHRGQVVVPPPPPPGSALAKVEVMPEDQDLEANNN